MFGSPYSKLRSQRDINLWRIPLQLSLGAVGLFWSLLPVCTDLTRHASGAAAIADVARRLLATDEHALYPADRIHDLAGVCPLTYAVFNYINFHNAVDASAVVDGRPATVTIRQASDRFRYAIKLAISADKGKNNVAGSIEFDRCHFTAEQMEQLLAALQTQLQRLATLSLVA